uniref:helicase-related protein n=1 Tax=unclassified Frankia TaxID=2632575 RepID=UPI002AD4796D
SGYGVKTTRRYQLGELLGKVSRHLLLMTATPHAGKQEDFQLFLALLDGDRFEGRFRDGVHSVDPAGLMRRMVKEDLLTMEGKPLFPERRAYTVPYELSPGEQGLYEAVTDYVRHEMNRADRLKEQGDGQRGTTVGFALTILQRRLASSPEAILRSLERRRARLERRRREMRADAARPPRLDADRFLSGVNVDTEIDDRLDDLVSEEREELEDDVADAATASNTRAELDTEIALLAQLEKNAHRVRHSGTDRKWSELRAILCDSDLTHDQAGTLRKIIIFTEHRDTLNYLVARIGELIGDRDAVVSIHGGVRREQRRAAQERFTQDARVRVLVATDAAGEGVNLQRAHLMVNYDLPWNPNRLEQRFGRIHRIGQTEVCHLWNLVASNTREGEVFHRLLEKVEQQRKAYAGKVFDVLGDAFDGQPLRGLLVEAIRYGDRQDVRARLHEIIDARVGEGLDELIAERALHAQVLATADVDATRQQLSDAEARRLQPRDIERFFRTAFGRLGGRIAAREGGRFEITHVPADVRARQIGNRVPVLARYERVTFDRAYTRLHGAVPADLLALGHPLVDTVVDLIVERHHGTLKSGTVLVDRNDPGQTPRLLVAMSQKIVNGHQPPATVSKRFDFVELTPDGKAADPGPAPYLSYEPLADGGTHALAAAVAAPWLIRSPEDLAIDWAVEHSLVEHLTAVEGRVLPRVARTRHHVRERLLSEIALWDHRHADLLEQESAGHKPATRSANAYRRARDLERRLAERLETLDAEARLALCPPIVEGVALVLPLGFVDLHTGRADTSAPR